MGGKPKPTRTECLDEHDTLTTLIKCPEIVNCNVPNVIYKTVSNTTFDENRRTDMKIDVTNLSRKDALTLCSSHPSCLGVLYNKKTNAPVSLMESARVHTDDTDYTTYIKEDNYKESFTSQGNGDYRLSVCIILLILTLLVMIYS